MTATPEHIRAVAEKHRLAWNANPNLTVEDFIQEDIRAQRSRNARLAALVTPELAALLERLGTAWTVKPSDKAYALTLAARIREALALEGQEEGK